MPNILAHSFDAVICFSDEGQVSAWNSQAERLFGPSAAQMVGCGLDELAAERSLPDVLPLVRAAFAGEPLQRVERNLPSSDKSTAVVEIVVTPRVEGAGVAVIARDITLARRAQEAIRANDSFLAALSHALRTPLTPLLMTAGALREDERLPAEVRDQLGMMESNIALQAQMVDDLLDLARIPRGELRLRPEFCDAHSIIGRAVETVREDAEATGIAIEMRLAAQRSGVMADPARLEQAIRHLLRNAVKFTPRGGRVFLRTSDLPGDETAGALRIEVADTGRGIEPAALEKIFLPFERTEPGDDYRFGGIGVGLAIARGIVELHGGRITAESAGPGKGATFTVELPGATEAPQGGADSDFSPAVSREAPLSSDVAVPTQAPLRLLLVEDHESTLEVLSRLLTRSGHHVVTANTLAAALAAAAVERFDLLISDLGLPDGTGHELMKILRARYGLRGIALSGYGLEEDVVRSSFSGFASHLTKPVDFRQLQHVLHEVAEEGG
ncbi:MAG: ATP-binding protein [Chthoniobacterales bacterium]